MSGTLTHVPAAPVVWPLVAVEVMIVLVMLRRRGTLTGARIATTAALGIYTAGALSVTLLPMQIATGSYANQAPWTGKINLIPLVTADPRNMVLNVLLTVPLGMVVPLLRRGATWRTAAATGFVASFAVETIQFVTDVFLSAGRTGDVNDLIANTAGALVGFAAVAGAWRWESARAIVVRYALWTSRGDRAVAH